MELWASLMISQFGLSILGALPTKVKTPDGGVRAVLLTTPGIDPTKDNTPVAGCTALVRATEGA